MLQEFYKNNPNPNLLGKVTDPPLTELQKSVNVYEPIEAYTEKWTHKENRKTGEFLGAEPVPGTRKRNDLPPLYIQWKEDWKTRLDAMNRRGGPNEKQGQ